MRQPCETYYKLPACDIKGGDTVLFGGTWREVFDSYPIPGDCVVIRFVDNTLVSYAEDMLVTVK